MFEFFLELQFYIKFIDKCFLPYISVLYAYGFCPAG